MQNIPDNLNGAIALNVCRTADGWQASLEVKCGTFRIADAATPGEAIAAVFCHPQLPLPKCPVPR